MRIEKKYVEGMVSHAKEDLPNECCGILAGNSGGVQKHFRMTNVEASPFRFSMDPREIVKVDDEAGDNDWELLAIYHSHTGSEAYPSDTDVRIAGSTAGLWPDVQYILVSLLDMNYPDVKLFTIIDGVVKEEPIEVV